MRRAAETLDELEIGFDARIISAHRTPDQLVAFAKGARSGGLKVVIAGAGGAAHLPGMTAAFTPLPVFGVPVTSKALSGQDSLLSIVQMPAGVPVGTLAIGEAGATNAALLAARLLRLATPGSRPGWTPGGRRYAGGRRPAFRRGWRAMILWPGRDDRHSRRPASSVGCWRWRRPIGLRSHVFAPEAEAPAFDVAGARTIGAYDDEEALQPRSPRRSTSSPTNSKTCRRQSVDFLATSARAGAAGGAGAGGDPGPFGGKIVLERAWTQNPPLSSPSRTPAPWCARSRRWVVRRSSRRGVSAMTARAKR